MQRSKQQALMFLLGAVLVGGALGFTADRYIVHDKFAAQYGPRPRFYDMIGLSQQQRAMLDSLSFARGCEINSVLSPYHAAVDSIRMRFKAQSDSVLTAKQREQLEQLWKEAQKRNQAEQAKEPKRQCPGN